MAIGRDLEIDRGWEYLATRGGVGPVAVLIEGDPGIGKSAVWTAIAARASEAGARILAARPAEPETAVSYSAMGDLLVDVTADDLARLPVPQRRALEVASLRIEPTQPIDDVRVVGTGMASLLRSLAQEQQVVIAIDDVQWLDPPSSRALTYGLRRLTSTRVAALLTRRANGFGVPPLGLGGLGQDVVERVALGPLSAADLAQIVEDRLRLALNRSQARRLHALSRGNALLAIEMARVVARAGDDSEVWRELKLSTDISALIADRVRVLPPKSRLALAAAAAVPDPRLELIADVLGSARGAKAALAPAVRSGVVDIDESRIRFEHPLLAAAAYGALSERDRAGLQRTLAAIVVDPEARARHLAQAGAEAHDGDAATISAGAQRASERGAQDAAADLAEAALRLTPLDDPLLVGQRTMAAATYLARSGELHRARELCERLLPSIGGGPPRVALLRLIGEIHLQEDSIVEGIERLEQAAAEAGAAPEQRLPIDLLLTYALVNELRPRDAVAHARRAVSDARRLAIPPLIATALAVGELSRFFAGLQPRTARTEEALAIESAGGGGPALFRPSLIVGMLETVIGRHQAADARFRAVADDARVLGDEASLVPALMYVSWNAVFCGDVESAAQAANEAADVARSSATPIAMAHALTATSRIALIRGNTDEARSQASLALDLYRQASATAYAILPLGVLASLAWATDDAATAIGLLSETLDRHLHAGFTLAMHPFAADLLEAEISVGRIDRAEGLIHAFASCGGPRGGFARSAAHRGRALLLAREGRLSEALTAIERALGALDLIDPLPNELARTLLVKGRIERRMKRRAAARATFEATLALFERLSARLWIERTRAEIDRIGGPAPNELSPAEMRVATLAARGLTNRQVAELAFVTPKSVEGILERVYSKLGIHSRAELGAWAASRVEPGGDQPHATSQTRAR